MERNTHSNDADAETVECPECGSPVEEDVFAQGGTQNGFERRMGSRCSNTACDHENDPFDTPTITSPCCICEEETPEDQQIRGRCVPCNDELERQKAIRQRGKDVADVEVPIEG